MRRKLSPTWSQELLALAIEAYAAERFAGAATAGWSLPATRFWVEDGVARLAELDEGASALDEIAEHDPSLQPLGWVMNQVVEAEAMAVDRLQIEFEQEQVEIVVVGREGLRIRAADVVRVDGRPLLGSFEKIV